MRINLATPYADKDAAKALGARWDSTKKTWYIQDVADLTPFLRWIPASGGAADPVKPAPRMQKPSGTGTPTPPSKGTVTGPGTAPAHCGCNVLPWDDCIHT